MTFIHNIMMKLRDLNRDMEDIVRNKSERVHRDLVSESFPIRLGEEARRIILNSGRVTNSSVIVSGMQNGFFVQ